MHKDSGEGLVGGLMECACLWGPNGKEEATRTRVEQWGGQAATAWLWLSREGAADSCQTLLTSKLCVRVLLSAAEQGRRGDDPAQIT